jgi:hypothetical protein
MPMIWKEVRWCQSRFDSLAPTQVNGSLESGFTSELKFRSIQRKGEEFHLRSLLLRAKTKKRFSYKELIPVLCTCAVLPKEIRFVTCHD